MSLSFPSRLGLFGGDDPFLEAFGEVLPVAPLPPPAAPPDPVLPPLGLGGSLPVIGGGTDGTGMGASLAAIGAGTDGLGAAFSFDGLTTRLGAAFGDFAPPGLPRLLDLLDRLDLPALSGLRARLDDGFDAGFAALLAESGLAGLDPSDLRDLGGLAEIAASFPADLAGPDETGLVPTGSAAIGREQAALGAVLSAVPRIVQALGPEAELVATMGETFRVTEVYRDPASGFLGARLTPVEGGTEVFAVDGLQVGSRADEVAAATLGLLQVQSRGFAEMVADAAAVARGFGDMLFVGPSLGGAVAQVAAYETAEALAASPRTFQTGAVQLVTVDPLGGRDAAEAINGGVLDAEALSLITALNLRTEGDIVSRIGSQIGATLTLPALDENGNRVTLTPEEAHVNVVSLLQTLSSDALFAEGTLEPPREISGFAAVSEEISDELIRLWEIAGGAEDQGPQRLQIPGEASFNEAGTVWALDADSNGTVDLTVQLAAPIDPARADLVI